MPTDIKSLEGMHEAVNALRTAVESKSANDAATKAQIEKIEKALDAAEIANQKIIAADLAKQKLIDEMNGKFELLEKQAARTSTGTQEDEQVKQEMKAFNLLARRGPAEVSADELKYLRTDNDTQGGFLVPQNYVAEMIKNVTEVSPIRAMARVRNTTSKSITMPRRTGIPNGGWTSEGQTWQAGQSSYGSLEIFARKLTVFTDITTEMLSDSAFDMASEINSDVGEDFGQLEAIAFLFGVEGLNQPEGILTNSLIQRIASGSGTAITGDNLIDMASSLKIGYDGQYLFSRLTLAYLRKLKGSTGYYLWTPGFAGVQPTINGLSYMLTGSGVDPNGNQIGMPPVAAGNSPVLFGDFKRGYTIVDNTNMTMLRDPFTQSTAGKVRFLFSKRVGGKVVQPEAFSYLNVATS